MTWATLIAVVVLSIVAAPFVYRGYRLGKAREARCPRCESRNVAGAIETEENDGLTIFGESAECLDCGLDRGALDGEEARLVEALVELRPIDPLLVEVQLLWLNTSGKKQRNTMATLGRGAGMLAKARRMLEDVRSRYEGVFDAPATTRAADTVGAFVDDKLELVEMEQSMSRGESTLEHVRQAKRYREWLEAVRTMLGRRLDERFER